MERDLDLVFARFAPPAIHGNDLDSVIAAAERHAFIDPDLPTASNNQVAGIVKRVEKKLISWVVHYLSQQVSAFGGVVAQALKLVARRLERLEEVSAGADPELLPVSNGPRLDDVVTGHLAGVQGRVLVAECGDGSLLRALAGLDAYGIEPRADLAESAALTGLDVRQEPVLDHLRVVEAGALSGVVLTGIVDRSPTGAQVALVEHAARVVGPGGRLAIAGTSPEAWGRDNPVEADLAPGRPFHPATWVHLLGQLGFAGADVVERDGAYVVTAAR
jgi:SAM-dependent methyltransferase